MAADGPQVTQGPRPLGLANKGELLSRVVPLLLIYDKDSVEVISFPIPF